MEQIALIYDSGILYRSSVLMTIAVLAAICGFLSLYLRNSKTPAAGFMVIPIALALSLLLARFLHWYAYPDIYPNLWIAITDHSAGGYLLLGAFIGCFLSAVITQIADLHNSAGEMLDYMCLAGGAAISVGRLGSFFNSSSRGQLIHSAKNLPWVSPVVNTVSGITEYRFATFLLQAAITGILTVALWRFYRKRDENYKNGDTALLFLLCYCAAQIILDSTRYDVASLRSNGFISIVQVSCTLTLLFVIVFLSVRMVKNKGLYVWNLLLWAGMTPLLALAGYMEYHVQRHSDQALPAYLIMTFCLGVIVWVTIFLYRYGQKPKHKQ